MSIQQFGNGLVVSIDSTLLNNVCLEAIIRSCPEVRSVPGTADSLTADADIVVVTPTPSAAALPNSYGSNPPPQGIRPGSQQGVGGAGGTGGPGGFGSPGGAGRQGGRSACRAADSGSMLRTPRTASRSAGTAPSP